MWYSYLQTPGWAHTGLTGQQLPKQLLQAPEGVQFSLTNHGIKSLRCCLIYMRNLLSDRWHIAAGTLAQSIQSSRCRLLHVTLQSWT